MVPWIQVYSNLPTHPKTARLAEELKLSSQQIGTDTMAVGILVSLWAWAIQNAYNGDLSNCTPRLIADVCRWKRKPELLLEALVKSGWVDETMRLHHWEEYAVLFMEAAKLQREKTRQRVRRVRSKQSAPDHPEETPL